MVAFMPTLDWLSRRMQLTLIILYYNMYHYYYFLILRFDADIDECAQQGGQFGNHCHLNTVCENTSGSYVCNCLPGYRRVDKFNCAEINECAASLHSCHENAECINTIGSYKCQCNDGYEGDGFTCKRESFYFLYLKAFFFLFLSSQND